MFSLLNNMTHSLEKDKIAVIPTYRRVCKFTAFYRLMLLLAFVVWGWSGGAMVLGKIPVSGRPTNLDKSRARAGLDEM